MLLNKVVLCSFNHVKLQTFCLRSTIFCKLNSFRFSKKWSIKRLYSKDIKDTELICNVGTIGHVDHGKTTLTAAITKYLSEKDKSCKYVSYSEIDRAPEEKARGITINIAHIGYRTSKRRYAHTDCPGHLDYIKNMISGASQMDAAILIVAANDGPMPQTLEHLLLAKQIGIQQIVVYINKADLADEEILDLVELEIRELLDKYGYDSEKTAFVKGSALLALNNDKSVYGTPSIQALLDVLDEKILIPERDYTSPFVLPIDNMFTVPGRGTVAVGTILKGQISKGADAELIGFDERIKTIISDIQIFQKSVPQAVAGENVGALLRGVKINAVRRGMWICARNSQKFSNHFEAQIYLLNYSEGGRHKPLPQHGYCSMLYSSTWNIYTRLDIVTSSNMLMPGEHAKTRLTLMDRMPMSEGQTFTIREFKSTVATGIVTAILDPLVFNKQKMNLIEIPAVEAQKI